MNPSVCENVPRRGCSVCASPGSDTRILYGQRVHHDVLHFSYSIDRCGMRYRYRIRKGITNWRGRTDFQGRSRTSEGDCIPRLPTPPQGSTRQPSHTAWGKKHSSPFIAPRVRSGLKRGIAQKVTK